ncbi:hypothetical protein NMY22_g2648 [Coprinellus aureogranulatus]|nr:hypothetical protein NMY22_g2648 [Coprinellus aureogranulatus]
MKPYTPTVDAPFSSHISYRPESPPFSRMISSVEDKHVVGLIADAKYHAKQTKVPLVDCMFFGSSCDAAYVVPVPVQNHSVKAGRYFDVSFRFYVNANTDRKAVSFCIDNHMIHVSQYPVNSVIPSEYQYSIFLSRNPGDAENALIKTIHGGSGLAVEGSVLVVRSDREGIVKPVYEDDRYFIETMLIDLPPSVDTMASASAGSAAGLLPAASITPSTPPVTPRSPPPRSPKRSMPRRKKVVKRPGWHEPPLILQEYRLAKMMSQMKFTAMPFPSAFEVFDSPELCQYILIHTDVYTIVAVSRVDKKRREIAQRAFRTLFKASVQPFVLKDDFSSFLDLMKDTGLGITGSALRILLASNSTLQIDAFRSGKVRWFRPDDFNIVVPRGSLQAVIQWFVDHGYDNFHDIVPWDAYKSSVVRIVGAFRRAALGQRTCHITISESIGNIMHIIFAGPMTSWMNVITFVRVYVGYPTLLINRHALRTDIKGAAAHRRVTASYIAKNDNSEWTGKCGKHCPALPRKSVGDEGIASFTWNHRAPADPVSRFVGTDYLLAKAVIHWRLCARCQNDKCGNFIGKPAPL